MNGKKQKMDFTVIFFINIIYLHQTITFIMYETPLYFDSYLLWNKYGQSRALLSTIKLAAYFGKISKNLFDNFWGRKSSQNLSQNDNSWARNHHSVILSGPILGRFLGPKYFLKSENLYCLPWKNCCDIEDSQLQNANTLCIYLRFNFILL